MSIHDEMMAKANEGKLYFLSPALEGYTKRHMYVSPAVHALLIGPWSDEQTEKQGNAMRALVDRYLTGGKLTDSDDKDADSNLKRLIPASNEIWEFRMVKEPPAVRIFGSFSRKDIFVALTWAVRRDLGEIDSKEWKLALQQYKYEWQRCFLTYTPLSGDSFNDYLSNCVSI